MFNRLRRHFAWFGARLLVECVTVAFAFLLAQNRLRAESEFSIGMAMILAVMVAWRIVNRLRSGQTSDSYQTVTRNFQLELTLLCAVYLILQHTGSVKSELYPILFLLLFVVGGLDKSVLNRMVVTLVAVGFELLVWISSREINPLTLTVHLGAITGFPLLTIVFDRAGVVIQRRQQLQKLYAQRQRAEEHAELYRLRSSAPSEAETLSLKERRKHLEHSPIRRLDVDINHFLRILKTTLQLHTIAVYWLSSDKSRFSLMDAVTVSPFKLRKTVNAGAGVFGAVLMENKTIFVNKANPTTRMLTYYARKVLIRSFIGVPFGEETPGSPIGVIVADRETDVSFGPEEEKVLQLASGEIFRIWNIEQQLNRWEQIRNEATGLYYATQGLIKALSLQDVVDQVTASFRKIYPGIDLAAVVLEENGGRSLVIQGVSASAGYAKWKQENMGREISRGKHLCALAIQKNMIVPEKAFDKRSRQQQKIFGSRWDPPGMKSVKVAPLKLASSDASNIGVLVLGSGTQAFFPERGDRAEDVKRTLETISNITAISIQNAKRYERLEELAALDALTGLFNRRRFLEIMEQATAEALRYEHPLSLILADIDYFKRVNDTYGHPMGDQVLKKVAAVLSFDARETDRICRYGGEEFAAIMPHTDKKGSILLAERFRKRINRQKFTSQGREFSVTLSFGICTLPAFTREKEDLINRADQALYHAKENGRDRVAHYGDI